MAMSLSVKQNYVGSNPTPRVFTEKDICVGFLFLAGWAHRLVVGRDKKSGLWRVYVIAVASKGFSGYITKMSSRDILQELDFNKRVPVRFTF